MVSGTLEVAAYFSEGPCFHVHYNVKGKWVFGGGRGKKCAVVACVERRGSMVRGNR